MRIDSIVQDVRYAVRAFSRTPIFAATVAATMGLALGLVGSAFTLLNAYLIRPVNLPNPRALTIRPRLASIVRRDPRWRHS